MVMLLRQEANPRACRRIHAEGTQQRASGSRWWHSVCDIFGIQHRNVLASNKGFVCFRNCLVPKHHRLADGPAILSDESRHLKFPSSCVARCNGCAAPVPAVCRPCACGVPWAIVTRSHRSSKKNTHPKPPTHHTSVRLVGNGLCKQRNENADCSASRISIAILRHGPVWSHKGESSHCRSGKARLCCKMILSVGLLVLILVAP